MAMTPLLRSRHTRRRLWLLGGALVVVLVIINVGAFAQAWGMTHYRTAGGDEVSLSQRRSFLNLRTLATGLALPRPADTRTPADEGLAGEVRHYRVGEQRYEVWHIPIASPRGLVLMFHGYRATKSSLLAEARFLHDHGWATLLVDFRGGGGSSGNTTSIGYYEADDVAAAVAYARAAGLVAGRPLLLYGRSMGAAAVLRAVAVHGLQLDGLILEAPFDTLANAVGNRLRILGIPAFPIAQLLTFWGGVQQSFDGLAHRPRDYATHATCPALFLWGAQDRHVTEPELRAVYAAYAGRKDLIVFPTATHQPFLTADPECYRGAVADFLRTVAPTAPAPPPATSGGPP